MVQWLRSLFFTIHMYVVMALMGLAFMPVVFARKDGAHMGLRTYCRYVRWSARWMIGLDTEVRGPVPTDEVIIASKHQSFLDIILITSVVPRFRFIMKKELRFAPVLGWYATRSGCVPVDRGKKAQALQQMVDGVRDPDAMKGQLVIYPQGTRVAAGESKAYKVGVGALYRELGQPVVPAATNVGVFWPRRGIMRKPGLAVVEFLPRIAPGKSVEEFMVEIEEVVEGGSNRLMLEAGFPAERLPAGAPQK